MNAQEKEQKIRELWANIKKSWIYPVDENDLEDIVKNLCIHGFYSACLREGHPFKLTLSEETLIRSVWVDVSTWGFIIPDQEEEDV